MIAGDPAAVTAGANSLLAAARAFADAADATGGDARSATAEWEGQAAGAALQALVALGHRAGVGVEVCRRAAVILQDYAAQLQAAQMDWLMGQSQLNAAQRQQDALRSASGMAALQPSELFGLPRALGAARDLMAAAEQRALDANTNAANQIQALVGSLQEMAPTPPPPPAPKPEHHGLFSSIVHSGLDAAGLIPVLGAVPDGLNALYYGVEGDKVNAGISAAAMIPLFGDGIMAAKYGYRGAKAVKSIEDAEHAVHDASVLEREVPRATLGHTDDFDYRANFEKAHPDVDMSNTVVHHAVEQNALKRFPDAVTENQLHSPENLRGIPNDVNGELHLSAIRKEWNRFYKAYPPGTATQEQLLDFATEVDRKYGLHFTPPIGQ